MYKIEALGMKARGIRNRAWN